MSNYLPTNWITQKRWIDLQPTMQKFSKTILINQIQQHIERFIHHTEVGFIPGILKWFNISKLINVIHTLINKR